MAIGTQPVGTQTHTLGWPSLQQLRRREVGLRQGGVERRTKSEQGREGEREKTRKHIFHLGTVRLWLS